MGQYKNTQTINHFFESTYWSKYHSVDFKWKFDFKFWFTIHIDIPNIDRYMYLTDLLTFDLLKYRLGPVSTGVLYVRESLTNWMDLHCYPEVSQNGFHLKKKDVLKSIVHLVCSVSSNVSPNRRTRNSILFYLTFISLFTSYKQKSIDGPFEHVRWKENL